MNRSGRFGLPLALVAALILAPPAEAAGDFEGLSPGDFVVHKQDVPVRIVLIGFAPGQVNEADLASGLPAVQKPLVRYPQFYGLDGRNLGLEFTFQYRVVKKDQKFTQRFFERLAKLGKEGPIAPFQAAYNGQAERALDVTQEVLYIDGPSVEKWLADNDKPPQDSYTIYFINWFSHPGFRFHVYTKTDEPDPDTKYNFGINRGSRKMVAWGGTHSRSWFYDFSAGPESWGGNFDVANPDIDGDGVPDYRIPVIWEYGNPASPVSRPASELGSDMGRLVRYVAIDLLFASSPLYDPLVTAPAPKGAKVAHLAMLEDDLTGGGALASNGLDFIDKKFTAERLQKFQPYYPWKVGLTDTNPIDAGAKNSLEIFSLNNVVPDCWNAYFTPFAQLFCYFGANRADYVPAYKSRDYVGPVFAFNTTEAGLGAQFGLLGFADDNWVDGTQSLTFVFGAEAYRELGYGFTSTVVHEFGHHVGVSHPHDGYDSESGVDFGPSADFYFAWLGDESDTVMHYLGVSNGFGSHDRDNMHRWEASGYLNWANALAGDILASPDAAKAKGALQRADQHAKHAKKEFGDWKYLKSVESARKAYEELATAAEDIGIPTPTLAAARQELPNARVRKDGCRPRFPNQ